MPEPLKVGVLASGRGSNFRALVLAAESGRMPAAVVVLVADRAGAPVLDIAREHRIEAVVVDPRQHPSREAHEKALEMLDYVGLRREVADQLAINLSYGDQRRVEIARALASDPQLLLLDEPTAGMNPQESGRLTDFMRQLRDERDLTILLIEHDMKVVMGVSERVTVLDHGEKIAEGDAPTVRQDKRVVEAYLGKQ